MGMYVRTGLSPFPDMPRTHAVVAAHKFPVYGMTADILRNGPENLLLPRLFIRRPFSDGSRFRSGNRRHERRRSPLRHLCFPRFSC